MHRHTGCFADGHQARHDRIGIAILQRQHFAMIIRRDTTHVVVNGRQNRDRLLGHVDAGENTRRFRNAGQTLGKNFRIEMIEMKEDVILVRTHTATFADFDGHGAADDVARGKILGGWRIALHETFAFGIDEITAFATRAFGDEATRTVNACRMELHEFHVLQRQACTQHHGIAVARTGMRRSRREEGAAITARREDHQRGTEAVNFTRRHVDGDDAAADAFLIHDEVDGKIFDVEFRIVAQRLAIKRMQHRMACTVGRRAGALGDTFTEIRGHATERTLIDLAFFRTAEGHAEMLELINGGRRMTAEIFNRVLVAEPVGTLDGVIHMPAPIVRTHVTQRSGNTALGRNRMTARRENLGDIRGLQPLFNATQCGAKTGATRPDDNRVERMVYECIGLRY